MRQPELSLFSAMAYVDDPKRRRRSSKRESALTHLLFEKDLVRQITFDEFSEEWLKKPRSLCTGRYDPEAVVTAWLILLNYLQLQDS